jgi:hypothetical protein
MQLIISTQPDVILLIANSRTQCVPDRQENASDSILQSELHNQPLLIQGTYKCKNEAIPVYGVTPFGGKDL